MKNTLLCLSAITALATPSPHAGAQTASGNNPGSEHNGSCSGERQRPTAGTYSRLIAYCESEFNDTAFVVRDSTFYVYSGSRGYDANNAMWRFDNATVQNYVPSMATFFNQEYQVEHFDAADNDTFLVYQDWFSGSLANSAAKLYHYNSARYIDTTIGLGWNSGTGMWVNSFKNILVFGPSNNVLQQAELSWNVASGTWDNYQMLYYSYNAAGDLTVSTTLAWNSVTAGWDSIARSVYTYDGAHDQLSRTDQINNSTPCIWYNTFMNVNTGFTGTNPLLRTTMHWNNGTSTYDSVRRWHYTYNSHNQVLTYSSESYGGTSWAPTALDYTGRYYYELYTSAVNTTMASEGNANVYPSPATDEVTIVASWAEAQPFTVTISDADGRMLRRWNENATRQYSKTLSVRGMPAGIYFVKIAGTQGEIVKQIVVSGK